MVRSASEFIIGPRFCADPLARLEPRKLAAILRDGAIAPPQDEDGASCYACTVFSGQRHKSLMMQTSQRGLRARHV
jgi:hypothetical protein